MQYLNFDINIEPQTADGYPVLAENARFGQARTFCKLDVDNEGLQAKLEAIARDEMDGVEIAGFGHELADVLLKDDVEKLLDRTLGAVALEQKNGVRLRLRINAPEMDRLPWELMRIDPRGDPVCLSTRTALTRYVELNEPVGAVSAPQPVRILGIIPQGSGLNTAKEKEALDRALAELDDMVQMTWLEGIVTRDHIREALLRNDYHLVHFIGHGKLDGEKATLRLNDDSGDDYECSAETFSGFFRDSSVRLVVLNACEGAARSSTNTLVGLAPQLVRRGVPAVVAMQWDITDRMAQQFASAFYRSLCMGPEAGEVETAITRARAVLFDDHRHSRAFATPVLYLRAEDGRLWSLASEPGAIAERHDKKPLRLLVLALAFVGVVVALIALALLALINEGEVSPTAPPLPTAIGPIIPTLPPSAPLLSSKIIIAEFVNCPEMNLRQVLIDEYAALNLSPPTLDELPAVSDSEQARTLGQAIDPEALVIWGECATMLTSHFEILSASGAPQVYEPLTLVYPEPIEVLDHLSNSALFRLTYALDLYLRRDYATAAASFKTVADTTSDPITAASLYLMQGNNLLFSHQAAGARQAFDQALLKQAGWSRATNNKGVAEADAGWDVLELDVASETLAKAIDEGSVLAQINLSEIAIWQSLNLADDTSPEKLAEAEDDCRAAHDSAESALQSALTSTQYEEWTRIKALAVICIVDAQFKLYWIRPELGVPDFQPSQLPDAESSHYWSAPWLAAGELEYVLYKESQMQDALSQSKAIRYLESYFDAAQDDVHLQQSRHEYNFAKQLFEELQTP